MLNFDLSKKATVFLPLARRTSSSLLMPTGSARTPLPSMTAIVLSWLRRISSTCALRIFFKGKMSARVRTGPKISVWTTSLNFGDVLLPKSELFINSEDILSNRQRGHSVGIMRDATELRRALSGGERFPPFSTPGLGVQCSPVHHVSGALCEIGRAHV